MLAEVSKMEGRTAKTTNLVIGGTEDPVDSDWLELDKKVRCHSDFLRGGDTKHEWVTVDRIRIRALNLMSVLVNGDLMW